MPAVTVELTARQDVVRQPILWRVGRLFNVVTTIHRARVTDELAHIAVTIEGTRQGVDQALDYLRALGVLPTDGATPAPPGGSPPEQAIPRPAAISLRLTTVNAAQARAPILHRVGKDFQVVVNIDRAAFEEEEGGYVDVTLSGPLAEVQRAIAYLHTTGVQVNPRQRSVTDFGNL
jgi:hypothetical protein